MSKIKLQSEYEDLDKYKNIVGDIFYYKKGTNIRHNPYGPALVSIRYKIYIIENKFHRLDGPALIYEDGKEECYINGKYLSKEEFDSHPDVLKYLGKEHLICLK